MRSYTLKLFWWFWLTAATAACALHLATAFTEGEHLHERLGESVKEIAALYGEKTAERQARYGTESALKYLAGLQHTVRISGFLFNEKDEETLGQEVPSNIRAILRKARDANEPVTTFERGRPLFAVPLESPSGHIFAGRLPNPFLARSSSTSAYRLLAAAFAAALLSWILAVRLTKPIKGLRETVQKFAAGTLGAREKSAAKRKDEIGALAKDFNAMADRIQALLKGQRQLLADVSHELRSPLTRLGVALELARRHASHGNTGASFDRMEMELGRVDDLIGSLLKLSRLDTLEKPEIHQNMNLSNLLANIADDGAFEGAILGKNVIADLTPDVSFSGDPTLLRRAVENLVRNAIRYSPEDGTVRVVLEKTRDGKNSGTIRILVEDQGPGVPENELKNIFIPFHRVEDARERTSLDEGCGLGLAIAKRAVILHGGTITARNRVEGGLVMEIALPGKES